MRGSTTPQSLRHTLYLGILLLLFLLGGISSSLPAAALDWINPAAQVTVDDALYSDSLCQNEQIEVVRRHPDSTGSYTYKLDGCIKYGKDIDVVIQPGAWPSLTRGVAIRRHGDTAFSALMGNNAFWLQPETNTFMFLGYSRGSSNRKLNVVDDVSASIRSTETNLIGGVVSYELIPENIRPIMWGDIRDTQHEVLSFALSNNGRYAAAYIDYASYVTIDFATGRVTSFFDKPSNANDAPYSQKVGAISNDGRYVLAGVSPQLFDTKDCGADFINEVERVPVIKACGVVDYESLVQEKVGYSYAYNHSRFIEGQGGAEGVEFETAVFPGRQGYESGDPKHITIRPADYVEPFRLKYLALGDSYSSGEGDIEKVNGASFYTPVTDFNGGCHISTRSYPFLLRDAWDIPLNDMQSVACSGAQVVFDYTSRLETYKGQDGRLASLTEADRKGAQNTALDRYIPGKVPQIEFVKKYKPKIITLTGGGNDVGFADIMKYCASSVESCGYASNHEVHEDLMGYIDDQYGYNKRLIDMIKQHSPQSKVYTVGYPTFIADTLICGLNSAMLDRTEIKMINDSVKRLNNVLRRVAKDTDTIYLDDEDALKGGRICEGSKYVTGWKDGAIAVGRLDDVNMFHPNAAGHKRMAAALQKEKVRIESESANQDTITPPALPGALHRILRSLMVATKTLTTGSKAKLALPAETFQAGTSVTYTLRSSPIELGVANVNDDGGVEYTASIPENISPGYHLLTATGTAPDGEPLQVQQFISVVGQNESDQDDDGIPDNIDNCLFISRWYDETGRDVCAQQGDIDPPGSQSVSGEIGLTIPKYVAVNKSNVNYAGSKVSYLQSSADGAVFSEPDVGFRLPEGRPAALEDGKVDDTAQQPAKPAGLPLAIAGSILLGGVLYLGIRKHTNVKK